MAGIAEISSHESAPALLTAADLLPPDTNTANMVEGVHLLQGELRYYHYGLQGFADHGWGCGYRTIQSILSWLAPSELPLTIPKMQALLRETNGSSFFGSRSWVGVTDAVQILDSIHDATVIVRTLKSGREAMSLLPELVTHFDLGGGPVMIGGGSDVYSKTVVGVSEGLDARTASLLIWDPHYSGVASLSVADSSASRNELWNGGWVSWKPFSTLRSDSFYNFALPRRPQRPIARAAQIEEIGAADPRWDIEVVESSAERDSAARATKPETAAAVDWASMFETVASGSAR